MGRYPGCVVWAGPGVSPITRPGTYHAEVSGSGYWTASARILSNHQGYTLWGSQPQFPPLPLPHAPAPSLPRPHPSPQAFIGGYMRSPIDGHTHLDSLLQAAAVASPLDGTDPAALSALLQQFQERAAVLAGTPRAEVFPVRPAALTPATTPTPPIPPQTLAPPSILLVCTL